MCESIFWIRLIISTTGSNNGWPEMEKESSELMKIFSKGFLSSFNAQVTMFPKMMNDKLAKVIDKHRGKAKAWKLSGAGGGGYLILISEEIIPNAIRVKIRINDYWI
jgi:mevalonate kinase